MPDLFTPNKTKTAPAKTPPVSPKPKEEVKHTSSVKEVEPHEDTPVGLFSSFCIHPKGVKFQNQESDEHILLFIRRHFSINATWIFTTLLMLIVPIMIIPIMRISGFQFVSLTLGLKIVIIVFYYLGVFLYALMNFIMWFYHVGIVTRKRLLDLDVYNILSHHMAETEIADIVDVSYSQKGFFQSHLNYGDVPIQTQAIKANFEFESAPYPAKVADIITDLRPQIHPIVHKPIQKGGYE